MPAPELLEVVVVANCRNTTMLPLPLTLLVPFEVVLLVPLEAADEPTSSELVGRTVVVLGAGGSARRLIWVSEPIESRIKEFTPGVRLILPPAIKSNGLSKNDCDHVSADAAQAVRGPGRDELAVLDAGRAAHGRRRH